MQLPDLSARSGLDGEIFEYSVSQLLEFRVRVNSNCGCVALFLKSEPRHFISSLVLSCLVQSSLV